MAEQNDEKFTVAQQNAGISKERNQLESVLNMPRELGICVEKPKFPQYAVSSKRMESFQTWPEYLPVSKKELVEAGLVYTGVGDSVRCYHCGGGLRNWEREDVPMEEHAKWYPKCPHVLLVKGQMYVDKLGRGEKPEVDCGESSKVQEEVKEIDVMQTLAAQSCLEMGFSEVALRQAIDVFVARTGHADIKGKDLALICFEIEEHPNLVGKYINRNPRNCHLDNSEQLTEDEDLGVLKEENQKLKESRMCKICVDNFADVIFLPCGHMVCCPQCAPVMTRCPMCRKLINGQLKAFFATK